MIVSQYCQYGIASTADCILRPFNTRPCAALVLSIPILAIDRVATILSHVVGLVSAVALALFYSFGAMIGNEKSVAKFRGSFVDLSMYLLGVLQFPTLTIIRIYQLATGAYISPFTENWERLSIILNSKASWEEKLEVFLLFSQYQISDEVFGSFSTKKGINKETAKEGYDQLFLEQIKLKFANLNATQKTFFKDLFSEEKIDYIDVIIKDCGIATFREIRSLILKNKELFNLS